MKPIILISFLLLSLLSNGQTALNVRADLHPSFLVKRLLISPESDIEVENIQYTGNKYSLGAFSNPSKYNLIKKGIIMAKLGGKEVQVNEEGFLVNPNDWDKKVAEDLAKELDISLTDKHWEVIDYLQKQHAEGVEMTVRKMGKSGIVDIKGLYELFPGGPLKYAAKIAGLPRPTSCV